MKITYIILCLTFTVLLSLTASAQNDALKNYDSETIYMQNRGFVKNGKLTKYGLFFKNLKNELKDSPEAMVEYDTFKKRRKTAFGLYAGGIVLLLAGAASADDNETVSLTSLAAGLGLCIASAINSINSANNIHKAVWLHNRSAIKTNIE